MQDLFGNTGFEMKAKTNASLKPLFRWMGGKTQLLDRLIPLLPEQYKCFYEPFAGGLALSLDQRPNKLVFNDINSQLINVYQQVRDNCEDLCSNLEDLEQTNPSGEKYYSLREEYNKQIVEEKLDVRNAVLFLYLNRHCFNGLYRTNSRGLFNSPWDKEIKTFKYDYSNYRRVSQYFKENDVTILSSDFLLTTENCSVGDFVFFDSPYDNGETKYNRSGFNREDHIRLSEEFKRLDKLGVMLIATNHNTKLIRDLYKEYSLKEIDVFRFINRDIKNRRGKELIITNFEQ